MPKQPYLYIMNNRVQPPSPPLANEGDHKPKMDKIVEGKKKRK